MDMAVYCGRERQRGRWSVLREVHCVRDVCRASAARWPWRLRGAYSRSVWVCACTVSRCAVCAHSVPSPRGYLAGRLYLTPVYLSVESAREKKRAPCSLY